MGFTQKDMIEQIMLLDEIKEKRQAEAIPALFDLYATPAADSAVDEMVYHTLFELLVGREKEILAGLGHASRRVRLLCVRQAGESASTGAKPVLLAMLKEEQDPEMAGEMIRSLGRFRTADLIGALLPYLKHDDYSVVAWTMQALVGIGGEAARDALREVVATGAATLGAKEICELTTALAVENLAHLADEQVITFLVGHIHHVNPSFRRVVINALVGIGADALDALEKCLEKGDKDERIMAANIIGMMGEKEGADVLIDLLDEGEDLDGNLRFAVYEALGRINSLKCVVGLADGLAETDAMVLMSVIIGMDNLCNPGIVKAVSAALAKGDEQSRLIAKTVANAHAAKLFGALYEGGVHGDALIKAVAEAGDQEAIALFQGELERIGGDKAVADSKKLTEGGGSIATISGKILAADDSKAIIFFYKGVATEMGIEMVTVPDGKDAFEYLQENTDIDLLITDMNMPVMDGVELTKKVREMSQWRELPIIMATTESEKAQSDLARAAGVNDFLSKPFTGEQLKEKIGQYLSS
ncbi:MAG: response regulator [Desulfobulbaceae bacterium]|nr:response regulator [Desulfobulbaceae bacterium]